MERGPHLGGEGLHAGAGFSQGGSQGFSEGVEETAGVKPTAVMKNQFWSDVNSNRKQRGEE